MTETSLRQTKCFTSNCTTAKRINQPDDEVEELFRLRARSTEDQPGNVYVFLRPRKLKTFKTSGKIYSVLNGKLEALYEKDKQNNNARFAQWISRLYSRTTQW